MRSERRSKNWFDEYCYNAKVIFKTERNKYLRHKTNANRLSFVSARNKYNRVKLKAKQIFRIKEGNRLNKLAKYDPKKFWKNIKSKYKKKQQIPDRLSLNDLYNNFNELFASDPQQHDVSQSQQDNDYSVSNEELDKPISIEEIEKAVFMQKNNKASGLDNLPGELFKCSFQIISPFLHKLYNRMFKQSEYPESWGKGVIAPIFKKGDVNEAKNYRGITLINILAKIYSQILLNRLTEWTNELNILSENQFGFQKGKSINDCVFILHSVINKVLSSGEKLYCVFIDYEKCFDKIDRCHLWNKLLREQVSNRMTNALKAMYTTVKACVRYNNNISDFFNSDIGLKQGDPSSPLLFMMFINDLTNHIDSDLNGIFTINELKLFLILYADDKVVFAKSAETVQSILSDIERYCNIWGLKINTNKTKSMIFEKGRPTNHTFFLYNTALEDVNKFKYLGFNLYKNGSWNRSQKDIAQHASFALNNLFNVFNHVELPVSQKCKLFDCMVASILNFGSELWGALKATDIEMIHTKFMRRILGVKKSTNLAALYGELGRVPLIIRRKINMIKYWIKILKSEDSSLVKIMYLSLKQDIDTHPLNSKYCKNWANDIKVILESHGLADIWIQQSNIDIPLELIKQRIYDTYKQNWFSEIDNSSRLQTYRIFKNNFEFENYLDLISETKYRHALTRFRVSSHKLAIETGRFTNIPRNQRYCIFCSMNCVENEYHFLLCCPFFNELRRSILKPFFCRWPALNKFELLLKSTSKSTLFRLSKFIYFADKKRILPSN